MPAPVYEILPAIAAVLFGAAGLAMALPARAGRPTWLLPAALSALFLAWSVWTISQQGLAAVWTEHTRNAWGNQIWFDLLMAIGLGLALLLPRARAAGMKPLPWLLLVAATGSVGLFAMMARCLFLEARPAPAAVAAQPVSA